jgi:hypothetical protein
VRARSIALRRLGAAGARDLAGAADLRDAITRLETSPYRRFVRSQQTLAEAQRAVAESVLWHMRVLAGWLPRDGALAVRVLAGGFEIANVDEQVQAMTGREAEEPYQLGALQTAWDRLRRAHTLEELRRTLAASAWGDPGAATPWAIHVGMRLAWADRVRAAAPDASRWSAGAVALLVAREQLTSRHSWPEPLRSRVAGVLGMAFEAAGRTGAPTLRALADALPAHARWALAAIDDETDLWRAEAAWWHRVDHDAHGLLRQATLGPAPTVGAVAVLAVDAWRVRAALETCARQSQAPTAAAAATLRAFDVVA